jgi:hypothetical protein
MKIVGLEGLVYGVADRIDAERFCRDFGLHPITSDEISARFETRDGSEIVLKSLDDPELPRAIQGGPTLREVVWGVAEESVLGQIRHELERDREVTWDGSRLHTYDDVGLGIAFQISRKRTLEPMLPAANVPGHYQRKVNTRIDFEHDVQPLAIAHVVINCENETKARAFYIERLGFKLSDEFRNAGAFIRTSIAREHHSFFTVQRAPTSLNHVAFYVTDFHELMLGGKAMMAKGWKTRWGPGRHKLGSNYFWYIHSPLGGAMEYTCDVDHVDDNWVPGQFDLTPDMTNIWSARDFPAV